MVPFRYRTMTSVYALNQLVTRKPMIRYSSVNSSRRTRSLETGLQDANLKQFRLFIAHAEL